MISADFSLKNILVLLVFHDNIAKLWSVVMGECLQMFGSDMGMVISGVFSLDCGLVLMALTNLTAKF